MPLPDRIEREISINAPIARVWELVSVPGWWIGDGSDDQAARQRRSREGDLDIIEDPEHGRFPIATVALESPVYAAFRWTFGPDREALTAGNSTLVEFHVSETGGRTIVRVVESGFATLRSTATGTDHPLMSDDERRQQRDDNIEGWGIELSYLQRRTESVEA